jgi:hypothetical protein
VTLNPLKLSNCGNLTHLTFLFPKYPHHIFFLKKKKNPNGVAGHHLWGGLATPAYIYIYFFGFFLFFLGFFFLFFKKKYDGGILGIIRPNWLNCHNLKLWGGG